MYGGSGQTNALSMANSVIQASIRNETAFNSHVDVPVHEQVLRRSNDYRAGHGQDDPIPNLPTMSI